MRMQQDKALQQTVREKEVFAKNMAMIKAHEAGIQRQRERLEKERKVL